MNEVYIVWELDSMERGSPRYIHRIYRNKGDAISEVDRLNEQNKQRWIRNASNGANRVNETWNWKTASYSVEEVI